jgi:hypothetical protein
MIQLLNANLMYSLIVMGNGKQPGESVLQN